MSGADDFVTWSHLKQKNENDCRSVCSWFWSELELNIFINKLQNGGILKEKKEKNNYDFFVFFSFKSDEIIRTTQFGAVYFDLKNEYKSSLNVVNKIFLLELRFQ